MGRYPTPPRTKNINLYKPEDPAHVVSKDELPYSIERTKNGWLPVYTDFKNGRTRVVTIIRKIRGDVRALAKALEAITVPENITIKPLNNHIHLKGNYIASLRDYFTIRKF
ncbi:hypothetical protein HK101_010221 [Irineochytrium annulatum]|nr:hypothetical protein HK101_010221 [Irineochytrium annulatum]